jgi:hypothetical protein
MQIHQNFLDKITYIDETRAFMTLMKKEKNLLLNNLFIEKNFKLPETKDDQESILKTKIAEKFKILEDREVSKERKRTEEFLELKRLLLQQ